MSSKSRNKGGEIKKKNKISKILELKQLSLGHNMINNLKS